MQNAGPLQTAGPLQSVAPVSVPGGLNIAAPSLGGGLPTNLPVLALTPTQLTTLTSGNATTMNQLLSQLVNGNTNNATLTTLVNTILTPPAPQPVVTLPTVSLPPISTPPPTPPPTISQPGPPPAPTPIPPAPTTPVNYVSRS